MLESPRHENIVISVPGKGSAKPYYLLNAQLHTRS